MHRDAATADPHAPRITAHIATVPCTALRVSIPLPPVYVLASLPTGKCYMQDSASRESDSCNVSVSIVWDVASEWKGFCLVSSAIGLTVRDVRASQELRRCSNNKDLEHVIMAPIVPDFALLNTRISGLFDYENSQFAC